MKVLYTSILIFFSFGLLAQMAPDFTVTDTHGNEHDLYADYLDQGKTVVLDLFFVDCPPCNTLAPLLEPLYQEWGAGKADVQFISLTSQNGDNDSKVLGFEEMHGTTWPAISAEGGGPETQQPYTTGDWGPFIGYPTLIVISPDGTVQFDIWINGNYPGTIDLLDESIESTGAAKPVSSIDELENVESFYISPNPVSNLASLSIDLLNQEQTNITIYNNLGQLVKTVYAGAMPAGQNSINIDTKDLIVGTYFIKVSMSKSEETEMFIKL